MPLGLMALWVTHKKCWHIVKDDFIKLFRDFSCHNIDLRSINSSIIALIPKKDNPETVNDYRPISLLNYSFGGNQKLGNQIGRNTFGVFGSKNSLHAC